LEHSVSYTMSTLPWLEGSKSHASEGSSALLSMPTSKNSAQKGDMTSDLSALTL
jgi:hypothetical protein